jgi:membrane protease YdiL (CAAX protease family)
MNNSHSTSPVINVPNSKLSVFAWVAMLIVGMPTIILRLLIRDIPPEPITPVWMAWTQLAILVVFLAVTWIWPTFKPLRGFILALVAFWVGSLFIEPCVYNGTAWSTWIEPASWGIWLIATFGTRLFTVALMALTLIGSGIGRRELFLVRGNPNAPCQPSRLLFMKEPEPWNRFARNFLLIVVIIMVIVVGIQVGPDVTRFSNLLIYLPAIVVAAAINAFAEEFELRSMLLSRLQPVLGSQQSMLISAVLFGLLHYFGWPSGAIGVLLAGYFGWIAAKSMIETRGFMLAFFIHFVGDFIIYSIWAMAA